MNDILLQGVVVPLLGIVVPLAVTWAAAKFSAWTGIQVEAAHREALQSALENAALIAIAKAGQGASLSTIGTAVAVDYVQKSVPDAVRHFDLSPRSIEEFVLPKIQGALLKAGAPAR